MKKQIFKILGVVFGLLIIAALHLNSSFFILNQKWKYEEGTHIGDWLEKNNSQIRDRVISTHNGKAKITFCFGKKLIIESLETKERGFYVNKSF